MATGNFVLDKGYRASAAISKWYAVKFDTTTTETVTPVTSNTDVVAGFAQFGVSTAELARGKGCSTRVEGITVAIAVGAIPIGALVTLNADGRVNNATTGQRVVGQCVGSPAVNANDQISLKLTPVGALAP